MFGRKPTTLFTTDFAWTALGRSPSLCGENQLLINFLNIPPSKVKNCQCHSVQRQLNSFRLILTLPSHLQLQTADVTELERKIGCGQVEELIVQAENELILARKMLSWKPWEPLVTKPVPQQWTWPHTK